MKYFRYTKNDLEFQHRNMDYAEKIILKYLIRKKHLARRIEKVTIIKKKNVITVFEKTMKQKLVLVTDLIICIFTEITFSNCNRSSMTKHT